MAEDKESYTPGEVAELMILYCDIYKQIVELRAIGDKRPSFIRSDGADAIRESIRGSYQKKIPENVRAALSNEDILRI